MCTLAPPNQLFQQDNSYHIHTHWLHILQAQISWDNWMTLHHSTRLTSKSKDDPIRAQILDHNASTGGTWVYLL